MLNRQVALVWAASLAALAVGCRGCAAPEEPGVETLGDGDYGVVDGVIGGASVWPVPGGISVIGQRDEAARYLSAVAYSVVSAPKETYRKGCDGVLVASNLVLTAAHCVCAPSHGDTSVFDGSECATKAEVHVEYWDRSVDGGGIGGWMDPRAGDILIHPRFQIVLDSHGAVVTSRADLAVIRLERPVPAKLEPVRLATEEVQVGEVVTVVGLGYDKTGIFFLPDRWLNRDTVQAAAGEDRLLFGPMDRAEYKGDTGGPCLREAKRGFELVGISQRGLGRTPTFTRIAPYREWLEEQIRIASGKR